MGSLKVTTGIRGRGATFKKKKGQGVRHDDMDTLQDMFSFNNASKCEVSFFFFFFEEHIYLSTSSWSFYR